MSTMFPEAYAEPVMQKIYEDEKAWGLPLPDFDFFMIHSVKGRERIKSSLGLKSGDDPFSWNDEEMFDACSKALLALRDKENLTEVQFAQLCWLETSLMEQVSFLDDLEQLGKYALLVTGEQVKFMQGWDMRVQEEFGDLEDDLSDIIDSTNFVEPSPELVEETSDRIKKLIDDSFSPEREQKNKKVRERVLTYLKTIK